MSDDRSPFHIDDRMQKILQDQALADPNESGTPPVSRRTEPTIEDIVFDMKPEELIAYLKSYIVDQDHAVEVVATKICTHFHRMKLEREHPELPKIVGHVKPNVLLIGPTGVGKTYMVKLIAHKLNVPFVKGDATKFSETGYVGGDVEDLVRELVHQVGGDIKLAEYGIIYIDEIDKIASTGNYYGPDVSRGGVQRNLLKLMEETEVDMKVPHDLASQMEAVMETQRTGRASRKKVNTRNILFVMSGAFNGLTEIIGRRLKQGGMGFSGGEMTGNRDTSLLLSRLHSTDMVSYGFESEFVGRIPVITYLEELDEDGLYGVLKNHNSAVVMGKKRDFAAYGIDLSFEDGALREIAKRASKHSTGARGLVGVVEGVLMPFERSLPSTGARKLRVTAATVLDPESELARILPRIVATDFVAKFLELTGIIVEIPDSALGVAVEKAQESGQQLKAWLDSSFKDYIFGLKLVGMESLSLSDEIMSDPAAALNRMVQKAYRERG